MKNKNKKSSHKVIKTKLFEQHSQYLNSASALSQCHDITYTKKDDKDSQSHHMTVLQNHYRLTLCSGGADAAVVDSVYGGGGSAYPESG